MRGGVTSHITHLYEHFVEAGHEVKIIAPSSQPQETLGIPDVIVCGRPVSVPASGSVARITLSLRLSSSVKAILQDEQFDVVHLQEPLMPMLPLTFLRFSNAINVGTFHAHRDSSIAYLYRATPVEALVPAAGRQDLRLPTGHAVCEQLFPRLLQHHHERH